MSDTKLEEAWLRFSENDVSVDAFFRSSGTLIGAEEKSFWEADLSKEAELKKFITLGLTSPSFHLSEAMAQLCKASKQPAAALELRIHALPMVPRWYPDAALRALGNMASDLYALGRYEESVRFGERALAWDPTNPFVLSTLARAYLHVGRVGDAFSALEYLDQRGYPSSLARDPAAADQKTLGVKRPSSVAPRHVDLGRLPRLSERDEAQALACNARDFFHQFYLALTPRIGAELNPSPLGKPVILRNHALITFMAGDVAYALLAAQELAAVPRDPNARVDLDVLWGRALADVVIATAGQAPEGALSAFFAKEEKKRLDAVSAAAKGGRLDLVRGALRDPSEKVAQRAATLLKRDGAEPSEIEEAALEASRCYGRYIGFGDDDPEVPLPFPLKKSQAPARGDVIVRELCKKLAGSKAPIAAHGVRVTKAPLPAKVIAGLHFPSGKPLPPSLAAWLAFDASWVGLFDDLKKPTFSPMTLVEALQSDFEAWLPDRFPEGFKTPAKLSGELYPLPRSGDQALYLYVGEADSRGEYPVLYVDPKDLVVRVRHAGFDMYVTDAFRHTTVDVPTTEQARSNLGGDAIDLAACFGEGASWGGSEAPAPRPSKAAPSAGAKKPGGKKATKGGSP